MESARPGAEDAASRILDTLEVERAHLAREIHDGPAQALSNAIFHVEYAERAMLDDPTAMAAEMRTLRDRLRRELDHVRGFLTQLGPAPLDTARLAESIQEAAEGLRTGMDVTVTTDLGASSRALDDRQRTVALRVTQEALQNVRKHAAAAIVSVRTDQTDDTWTVEIRDDGRGFDIEAMAARGRRSFGLQFMRERAELIGADFDVLSRPDGGTVVRLAIPTASRTATKENG